MPRALERADPALPRQGSRAQRPQSADELWRALDAALPPPGSALPAVAPAAAAPSAPAAEHGAARHAVAAARPHGQRPDDAAGAAAAAAGAGSAPRRRWPRSSAFALMSGRQGGRQRPGRVTDAQPPPPAVAPPPPARRGGRTSWSTGVDGASVLVDGKLVAAGVREARVPDLAAGEPHQLRVEAAGQPVHERTFTVAAGAEAELAVTFTPPAPAVARCRHAPGAQRNGRAHVPSGPRPRRPTSATPAASKTRHRDGLVGDDIFEGAK